MDHKTPVLPALLPVDFLWIPLCCVHLSEAVSFQMSYFQLQSLRKTVIWRPEFQFTTRWRPQTLQFWIEIEHQIRCGVQPLLLLLLFGRCWGLFRSGVAFQPWSRSCFDAAASSSTAPAWACRSWPPHSAPTPAPRGMLRRCFHDLKYHPKTA